MSGVHSELPESLDKTYERILKEIKKPNRDHALRLLQCLVVAIRLLRVEELAEVLAVDFDDAEGIPKLNPSWRWEDKEQALLSSCSSLIAIVDSDDRRVVQFSHFSVKEFLTSPRLVTPDRDVSRYHIVLEPAHTILAQACLSVLLQPDEKIRLNGTGNSSPLAGYAARHWVSHAQSENVSWHVRKAMEYLFHPDKLQFAAWLRLHDMDTRLTSPPLGAFVPRRKLDATPLYYAALCGFQDLVNHLMVEYPHHVKATGGYYMTPVVAALAGRHFELARLLHRKGSSVNVRGIDKQSPLHSAAFYGDLEVFKALLEYKADIEARDDRRRTPLHAASQDGHRDDPGVVRLLLKHGADSDARKNVEETPLHVASQYGSSEVAKVLLEDGADLNARTTYGETPLHRASMFGQPKTVQVLLQHGASLSAWTKDSETPIHLASGSGNFEVVHMLLERGANPTSLTRYRETPLHRALRRGDKKVAGVLLRYCSDPNQQTEDGELPLHLASEYGESDLVRLLLEHGASVEMEDKKGRTAYQVALARGHSEIMKLLLEHGAEGKSLRSSPSSD